MTNVMHEANSSLEIRSSQANIVCYFLSRFDRAAYNFLNNFLNLSISNENCSFSKIHDKLGETFNVKSSYIKNCRDCYDSIHSNKRKGWHQRPLRPKQQNIVNKYKDKNKFELEVIIKNFILNNLINNLQFKYSSLSKEEIKVIEKISKTKNISYNKISPILIFNLNPKELLDKKYFGKKSMSQLKNLKLKIKNFAIHDPIDSQSFIKCNIDDIKHEIENYRFNHISFDKYEKLLFSKLSRVKRMSYKDITPLFIFNLNHKELSDNKSFGKKSLIGLEDLNCKILSQINKNLGIKGIILDNTYGKNFSFTEIYDSIIEDLIDIKSFLNDDELYIFNSRLNWKNKKITLQETANNNYSKGRKKIVTRERIRQREEKLLHKIKNSIRIQEDVLFNSIEKSSLLEIKENIKKSNIELFKLICKIVMYDYSFIESKINPFLSNYILDEFFITTGSPTTLQDIKKYIETTYDESTDSADIIIEHLFLKRIIIKKDNFIFPFHRKKEVVVAHYLGDKPNGLKWKDIALGINKLKTLKTNLDPNRIDYVCDSSKYIFKSGEESSKKHYFNAKFSIYSHTKFLDISSNEITCWLNKISEALKKTKSNTLSLKKEYYDKIIDPNINYFKLRYIIMEHGYKKDIFIYGKSNTDTISLNKINEHRTISVQMFDQIKLKATNSDKIRRKCNISFSHFNLVLKDLLDEGKIVVDEFDNIDLPKRFFNDDKINKAINSVQELLKNDVRIIHIEKIIPEIKGNFKNPLNGEKCIIFLKAYAKKGNWFYFRRFVSNRPIRILPIKYLQSKIKLDQDDYEFLSKKFNMQSAQYEYYINKYNEDKKQNHNSKKLMKEMKEELSLLLLNERLPIQINMVDTGEIIVAPNRKINSKIINKIASNFNNLEMVSSPIKFKIMDTIERFNKDLIC